jgi:hypothetical protein
MSVRVSFVLSCVGTGLATRLIYKIHTSRLILTGNRPEGLIRKAEEEEEEGMIMTISYIRLQGSKYQRSNGNKITSG